MDIRFLNVRQSVWELLLVIRCDLYSKFGEFWGMFRQ